jgi:hypothetical protein
MYYYSFLKIAIDIFPFLIDAFFPLSPTRLTRFDYEKHGGCIIRNRNYLPLANTWVNRWLLIVPVLLML